MNLFQKKPQQTKLIVLLASKDPDPKLVDYLARRDDVILRETFSTRGVIRGLPDADLVVLGPVISLWDVDETLMQHTLESTNIPVATPEAMLTNPEEWFGSARLTSRKNLQYLPMRYVLVTGWAGGVGKSTIALGMAKRFRERNLPTALFEASAGGSYLISRLGPQLHSLYDIITGDAQPSDWHGVKLFPLDHRSSQVLADDARLPAFLSGLRNGYTLTMVDASPDHPFWPRLLDLATTVFIVTAPRDDSLYQAETLQKELEPVKAARPDLKVYLTLNMVQSLGQRIGLSGLVSTMIPYNERWANQLDARLFDPLLNLVYPGWMEGGAPKVTPKQLAAEKAEKTEKPVPATAAAK